MTNRTLKLLAVATMMTLPVMSLARSASTAQNNNQTSNQSTIKIDEVRKPDEKMKDIDEEITDARMRAQLGSKSQWSFKSSLNYSGGSIQDPFNSVRPNYRASATIESMTSLSGDVGINFRATDRDNINLGTGLTIIDPLHGDITKPADDSRSGASGTLPRYQVSTPFIGWSRGYKALNMQNISSVTYSHATDSTDVDIMKTFGSLSLSQTVLANLGAGWTGGVSLSLSKYFYSGAVTDPRTVSRMQKGIVKRTDLTGGLFPFMQYSFNDTYSFRTVFGYFQFTRYQDYDDNVHLEPYQSVGVGISVTRDIYLYPNVQFTPRDVRGDRTNVALSANINVF